MRRRSLVQRAAVVAALMVATTSCLSEGGGGGGSAGSGGTAAGDKEVEILFGFGGEQSTAFQQSLADFTQRTGINIRFSEASQQFNTLVQTRVQGNNLPDIALFPQPGILQSIAETGKLADLGTVLDINGLQQTLVPGELEAGTSQDGVVYGTPVSANLKSLVFYPKDKWEAAGYPIPKTQQELLDLTNRIKGEGKTPWCLGIGAAASTGWPATDWMEEYVLRIGGPEKYDQWVSHEIPFNDPVALQAGTAFEEMTLATGNVLGGRESVASNSYETAANPMFDPDPGCWMHRQGNFITQEGFFPDDVRANIDQRVGVFQFPGETPDSAPVLGGGDLMGVFNAQDPDTQEVAKFLAGPDYEGTVAIGASLSPHKTFDLSKYPDEITRQIAQIMYGASVFRFDGSDLMPGEVGSGSFWREMTAWISGQTDLQTALDNIENSWPSGS
jgi:alpha-glucoside transport system substrate-binding protein